jgi:hypothetical protein
MAEDPLTISKSATRTSSADIPTNAGNRMSPAADAPAASLMVLTNTPGNTKLSRGPIAMFFSFYLSYEISLVDLIL